MKSEKIKVFIYVTPLQTNGDIYFYKGVVEKKLITFAEVLFQLGYDITFILSSEMASSIFIPSYAKVQEICSKKFFEQTGIYKDLDVTLYENNNINIIGDFFKQALNDEPDLIFAWECCTDHLKYAYPEAKIVHFMPAFLSRLPYPDLLYFDTKGLFKKSELYDDFEDNIADFELTDEHVLFLEEFEEQIKNFYFEQPNIKQLINDTICDQSFTSLSLLALQYSKHYNFVVDSKYNNQHEVLSSVLTNSSFDKGVLVTQYITTSIIDDNINDDNIHYLKEIFPNLLFNNKFNSIDNISQYLLPYVDEVITSSSSIGLHGLLFNKKVTIVGDTFISKIIDFAQINNANRMKALAYLLFEKSVPFLKLIDREFCAEFVKQIMQDKKHIDYEYILDYPDFLLSSLRFTRAAEKLNETLPSKQFSLPAKIIEQINAAEIISFDIFDTLLERPLTQPTDVFLLIEKKLKATVKIPFFEFSRARIEAERIAKGLLDENIEEVTLDQIYSIISLQFKLTEIETNTLKQIELDTEEELLTTRPIGKKIYDLCLVKNKEIIFTSDMYLSQEFLTKVMVKNGYTVDNNLFVSSELKVKKRSGNLFKLILDKKNIDPKMMMHFGDNSYGDDEVPRSLGIPSVRLVRSVDKMFNHPYYTKIFSIRGNGTRTLQESMQIYLIARRFFDNPFNDDHHHQSFFNNSPRKLGYAALGQCIVDFALWINKEAILNENSDLFFLARDGKIVKEIYDTLFNNISIKTHYMYGSRKLMRYTSIPSIGDVYASLTNLDNRVPAKLLFDAFGWYTDNHALTKEITTNHEKSDAYKAIADNYAMFIEQSAKQNLLLNKYCENIGLSESKKPCVIDIGYAGTIQYFLSKSVNKDIDGLYFILLNTAENRISDNIKMKGYVGHLVERIKFWHRIVHNGFMYETLFCSDEDTIVSLRQTNNGISAVREANDKDIARKRLIRDIHTGAREYAQDTYKLLKPVLPFIDNDPELGSRLINAFLKTPGGKDAEIFEGIIFMSNFKEDSFRYIIPPRNLYTQFKNKRILAIWQEGCEVFFRRKDIFSSNSKPQVKNQKIVNKTAVIEIKTIPEKRSSLSAKLEKKLVYWMCKNNYKKRLKYDRDPRAFFSDSKSKLVKIYLKLIY